MQISFNQKCLFACLVIFVNLYTNEEIVNRAYRCLGEDNYNLLFNNCEHFACWCVTGEKRSEQVRAVMRHTSTAVLSYYAIQRYGLLATTSVPIATTTMTSPGASILTNAALGGTIGATTAAAVTTTLGTSAVTSTALGIAIGVSSVAAAPAIITAGVATAFIGGLVSIFRD